MNVDPRKINLSEKDLEDYLFENPGLVKMPFTFEPIERWFGRQLHVPSGIIDLIGVTVSDRIAVVELKNTEIFSSHLTQVCRYAVDIENAIMQAGYMGEIYVTRILISTYQPSHQMITEARAVNVHISTIDVNFDMGIGGYWKYSDSYLKQYSEELDKLKKIDVIDYVATISQAKFASEQSVPNLEDEENG